MAREPEACPCQDYEDFFQNAPCGYLSLDPIGRILFINRSMKALLGYEHRDLVGHSVLEFLAADSASGFEAHLTRLITQQGREKVEVRLETRSGCQIPVLLNSTVITDAADNFVRSRTVVVDISERKHAEDSLKKELSLTGLFQAITVTIDEATSIDAAMLRCITQICTLTEWPVGHIYYPSQDDPKLLKTGSVWYLADPVRFRCFQEHSEAITFPAGGGMVGSTFVHGRPTWIPDVTRDPNFWRADQAREAGLKAAISLPILVGTEVAGVMEFFASEAMEPDLSLLDVMAQIGVHMGRIIERNRSQQLIQQLMHSDPLTHLPNRRLFTDRLNQARVQAQLEGGQLALMVLDLDRFKFINDSLGHEMGDRLIQQVAVRLLSLVNNYDHVARLGGDEFAILLPRITNAEEAAAYAQRLLDIFAQPFRVAGQELYVTTSVGISLYPDHGPDPESLLCQAENALDRAKENRNHYALYSEVMGARSPERIFLEQHLRKALNKGELLVHYQPQISLKTGRVMGAEALVRWQHPELGLVSPAKFIPLAEDTGLIIPITEWVLQEVCEQSCRWQRQGLEPVRVSVNLSGCHFKRQNLLTMVTRVLAETGLAPEYLELELTEGILMKKVEETIATLARLSDIGVQFAVDDFGTGYSSLSYLHRFPINTLKIDRSFVKDAVQDSDSRAIIKAITTLGHNLDLNVVAEGTETGEQIAFLRAIGCDVAQGFYFSKPLPAEKFATYLSMPVASLPQMGA